MSRASKYDFKDDRDTSELNDLLSKYMKADNVDTPRERPCSEFDDNHVRSANQQQRTGAKLNFAGTLFHKEKKMLKQLQKPASSLDLSSNKIEAITFEADQTPSVVASCANHDRNYSFNANIKDLKELVLSKNLLSSFPLNMNLRRLLFLDISHNNIKQFPTVDCLSSLSNLEILNMSYNAISTIPSSINCLTNLYDLDLSNNCIKSIAPELFELIQLKRLQLNDNELVEISISDLVKLVNINTNGLKNGLNLKRNEKLVMPPLDIAKKGIISIRDFYRSINEKPTRNLLIEFKIYVLGHDGAGKTELVKCLHRQFGSNRLSQDNITITNLDRPSTNIVNEESGVQITQLSADRSTNRPGRLTRSNTGTVVVRDFNMHIWHFKGKEAYHPMHEVFFTTNALYIITWSLVRESFEQINNDVQYWIDLIQARAPGATILIVGTHADTLSADRVHSITTRAKEQLDGYSKERIRWLEKRMEEVQDEPTKLSLQRLIHERESWKCEIIPVNCREDFLPRQSSYDRIDDANSEIQTPYSTISDRKSISMPHRHNSYDSGLSTASEFSQSDLSALSPTPVRSNSNRTLSTSPYMTPRQGSDKLENTLVVLRDRIVALATPSQENLYPFGIIGYNIPQIYHDVRRHLRNIRIRADFCSFDDILNALKADATIDTDLNESDGSLEHRIRHALSYLSTIGEIFWIESGASHDSNIRSVTDKSFNISRIIFLRQECLTEVLTNVLQISQSSQTNDGVITWKDILAKLRLKKLRHFDETSEESSAVNFLTNDDNINPIDPSPNRGVSQF